MHDALGDALVIEVGDLLAKVEVFEQRRPAVTGLQRVLIILEAYTLVRRQHRTGAVLSHEGQIRRLGIVPRARQRLGPGCPGTERPDVARLCGDWLLVAIGSAITGASTGSSRTRLLHRCTWREAPRPIISLRADFARAACTAVFTSFFSSGGGSTAGSPNDASHSSRAQPVE